MHGKSLDVVGRVLGSEMIKKQKGIKIVQSRGGDTAFESDAGPFHDGLGFNNPANFTLLFAHGIVLTCSISNPNSDCEFNVNLFF
jgi:hypothetical protein